MPLRDKHLWSSNFIVQEDPGSPNFGVKKVKGQLSSMPQSQISAKNR